MLKLLKNAAIISLSDIDISLEPAEVLPHEEGIMHIRQDSPRGGEFWHEYFNSC